MLRRHTESPPPNDSRSDKLVAAISELIAYSEECEMQSKKIGIDGKDREEYWRLNGLHHSLAATARTLHLIGVNEGCFTNLQTASIHGEINHLVGTGSNYQEYAAQIENLQPETLVGVFHGALDDQPPAVGVLEALPRVSIKDSVHPSRRDLLMELSVETYAHPTIATEGISRIGIGAKEVFQKYVDNLELNSACGRNGAHIYRGYPTTDDMQDHGLTLAFNSYRHSIAATEALLAHSAFAEDEHVVGKKTALIEEVPMVIATNIRPNPERDIYAQHMSQLQVFIIGAVRCMPELADGFMEGYIGSGDPDETALLLAATTLAARESYRDGEEYCDPPGSQEIEQMLEKLRSPISLSLYTR